MESSENTISTSTSCVMTSQRAAFLGGGAATAARCSTSLWISRVPLTIRKGPPPIRMISRQDTPISNTVNSGSVRPISQVRPKSIMIRNTNASDRPICRTSRESCCSQREVRIEMKIKLSMPSTISSTDNVTSASQALGSSRSSIMPAQPIGQSNADEVEGDDDKSAGDPGFRIEITQQSDRGQTGPQQDGCDIDRAQPHHPERMQELEGHEGQHRKCRHDRHRKPRIGPQDK